MQFRLTIRNRILVAFGVFGLVLGFTMALSLYAFLGVIEESIIEQTMAYEMSQLAMQPAGTVARGRSPESVRFWSSASGDAANVPVYVRSLDPGTHRIVRNGRQYRVLVRDDDGVRHILRYDVTRIAERDRQVLAALGKSVAAATLISLIVGWLLSRRVTRPLRQLAGELHGLDARSSGEVSLTGYADDEVGELAARLSEYHNRFCSMLQREHEFASNVSHELRTPVTSINMAVEVLANDTSMSAQQRARLTRIQRAGREMSELVRTFMLLARSENAGEDTESCDVNAIARRVIEDQRIWLGDKSVAVEFEEQARLVIEAPPGIVSVLIANVVRNAFRYTREGTVVVTVTDDGVQVEDSGPGIDPTLTGRLFSDEGCKPEGTGLGFVIVRRICERYGWNMHIKSSRGLGTRFRVTLGPQQGSANALAG